MGAAYERLIFDNGVQIPSPEFPSMSEFNNKKPGVAFQPRRVGSGGPVGFCGGALNSDCSTSESKPKDLVQD